MKGWRKLYTGLLEALQNSPEDIEKVQLLQNLQNWLKINHAEFGTQILKRYSLDEYPLIDLNCYPVDQTNLEATEELGRLRKISPGSLEVLAMFLRDIFWSGITLESGVQCPRCGDSELRVLHDVESGEPIFACDLCTWAQKSNKQPWQGNSKIIPPTIAVLAQWSNLLKSSSR